jgi:hypothetical protein
MRNPFLPILASAAVLLGLSSCTLNDILMDGGGVDSTQTQVVNGLRTALSLGIDSGADFAGKVDGYLAHAALKILLPEDAAQALASARQVGARVAPFSAYLQSIKSTAQAAGLYQGSFATNLGRAATTLDEAASLEHLSDSLIKYMNRAAEKAAPRSVPIFKSAIVSMTISDGLSLLDSRDSTAATAYLNGRTFQPLAVSYAPLVDSTLALVPLTRYWTDFRTTYNALLADYQSLRSFQSDWNANPAVQIYPSLRVDALAAVDYKAIDTESLGLWTTEKALTGLFYLVGEQEKHIRRDPLGFVQGLAADAAELIKKVFGEIMDMGASTGP